jgi:hypothetical protein
MSLRLLAEERIAVNKKISDKIQKNCPFFFQKERIFLIAGLFNTILLIFRLK